MLFCLTVWSFYAVGLTSASYGDSPSTTAKGFVVERDQPFFASCYNTGHRITDIYWSRPDGQRVKDHQGSNVYVSKENGQLLLIILEAREEDEGEYSCQEIGDGGEKTLLERFSLKVLEKSEPIFERQYEVVKAYEGVNLTLICEAAGDQPINYTWLDQHSSIITNSSSDAVILDRKGRSELYLPVISTEASGVYTCVAKNYLGTDSKLFELIIYKREDEFPPFFNISEENVYGNESERLELICIAESKPLSKYKWFDKNGTEMNKDYPRVIESTDLISSSSEISDYSNDSIIIDVSGNFGLLSFVSLKKSDSGNYACRAENHLGVAYKGYVVYVSSSTDEYPPVFDETRVTVYGTEDESLTLDCEAEGNPRPTYVWYNKYGEKLDRFHQRVVDLERWNHSLEIPHKRPSTILVVPSKGTLVFVQVKSNDAGHYTCYAQNSAGRAAKTYRIYVNKTGDDLTGRVRNVTHNSVTFELIFQDDFAIQRLEVKYMLQPDNSRVERNVTTKIWQVGDEYKVTGLLSGAKYSFEFRILPTGNWTIPIIVALPPGPPEIIIKQVAQNKLNMEFFRPTYMFFYNSIERYLIKYRTVQQVGGNTWNYGNCEITIEVPSCTGSSYEISNLASRVYYSITVQAIGPGGKSELSEMKIFIP